MAGSNHTYGPTCHLAHTVTSSRSKGDDSVPAIKAQFFYSSPLPIDDPLTAVPASAVSDSKLVKHDPRPFSPYDNNALEEAWLSLAFEKGKKNQFRFRDKLKAPTKSRTEKRASIVSKLAAKHNKKHAKEAFFGDSTAENHKKLEREATTNEREIKCEVCPSKSITMSTVQGGNYHGVVRYTEGGCGHLYSSYYENSPRELLGSPVTNCCAELESDCRAEHRKAFGKAFKMSESIADHRQFLREVMEKAHREKDGKILVLNRPTGNEFKKLAERSGPVASQGDAIDDQSPNGFRNHGTSPQPQSSASTPAVDKSLKDINKDECQSRAQRASEKCQHSEEHRKIEKPVSTDHTTQLFSTVADQLGEEISLIPGNPEIGTTGSPFKRVPERDPRMGLSSRPTTAATAMSRRFNR